MPFPKLSIFKISTKAMKLYGYKHVFQNDFLGFILLPDTF